MQVITADRNAQIYSGSNFTEPLRHAQSGGQRYLLLDDLSPRLNAAGKEKTHNMSDVVNDLQTGAESDAESGPVTRSVTSSIAACLSKLPFCSDSQADEMDNLQTPAKLCGSAIIPCASAFIAGFGAVPPFRGVSIAAASVTLSSLSYSLYRNHWVLTACHLAGSVVSFAAGALVGAIVYRPDLLVSCSPNCHDFGPPPSGNP